MADTHTTTTASDSAFPDNLIDRIASAEYLGGDSTSPPTHGGIVTAPPVASTRDVKLSGRWSAAAILVDEADSLDALLDAARRFLCTFAPEIPRRLAIHLLLGGGPLHYAHVLRDEGAGTPRGVHARLPGEFRAGCELIPFRGGFLEVRWRRERSAWDPDLETFRCIAGRLGILTDKLRRFTRAEGGDASALAPAGSFGELLGEGRAMAELRRGLLRASRRGEDLLLLGESGTGKEMAARGVHEASGRRGRFVAVNCCELTRELSGSALFGHVKGAFTGAQGDRKGAFRAAEGGTLLLDEVNSLGAELQGQLLRALENREIVPLGSDDPHPVDVRLVYASNASLADEVRRGTFRQDLFNRIHALVVRMPPLRERLEDLPLLVGHFLVRFSRRYAVPIPEMDADALQRLREHAWPGNVRELQQVLTRATLHCDTLNSRVRLRDIERALGEGDTGLAGVTLTATGTNFRAIMDDYERRLLTGILDSSTWNLSAAARQLGMTRQSLTYRVRRLQLERNGA
jgi:DNA-binding NtrC family response regulator